MIISLTAVHTLESSTTPRHSPDLAQHSPRQGAAAGHEAQHSPATYMPARFVGDARPIGLAPCCPPAPAAPPTIQHCPSDCVPSTPQASFNSCLARVHSSLYPTAITAVARWTRVAEIAGAVGALQTALGRRVRMCDHPPTLRRGSTSTCNACRPLGVTSSPPRTKVEGSGIARDWPMDE